MSRLALRMTIPVPHLRIARPSRDLAATTRFYVRALGLEVLASFVDHAGFDGVMLGQAGWPYHLEFTRRRTNALSPSPTDEDLLVLYFPDRAEWTAAVLRLRASGAEPVPSSNPYWDERGVTFEDPDGYRIVIQNAGWPVPDAGGAVAATLPLRGQQVSA
jgi:catechol 2,3-dioxygenase-like lactoylglutathione lyase family enzyme